MARRRRCIRCGYEKSLDDFYYARARSDRSGRYYSYCKECHTQRTAARQKVLAMERATEGAKQCGLCEKAKPLADFYKVGTTRDGYSKRCKECQREQARVRHLAKFDPVKAEAYRVKCLYGVTLVEIAERWLAQGERCVICRTEGEPVVEHDHQTGEFRGLTSSNCTCNQAMGLFKDDPERCLAAYHYLKAARCVEVGA